MKSILSTSIFCVLTTASHCLLAQTSFIKVYNNANSAYQGNKTIQTSDGGYAVIGKSSGVTTYFEVFLMKTDVDGNMNWFKTYGTGDLFNVEDAGYDVQQTADGGYILVAESLGSAYDQVYVIKTNATGDTSWTRQYEFSAGMGKGFSIRQTTDDGYIIGGSGALPNGTTPMDAALIKLDENGILEWCKLFGGSGVDLGQSAIETIDGGYAITAKRISSTTQEDILVVRTNEDGDTTWARTYGGAMTDIPEEIIQTTDGGFLITGRTHSFNTMQSAEKFLLKLNSSGDIQWSKTYGRGWMNSVMETVNGYVFGGMDISVNGMLTGTDFDGNTIWAAQYGLSTYVTTYRFSAANDGGFITSGNFYDGTLGGMMLLKTASNGYIPCHYTDALAGTQDSLVPFSVSSGCNVNTATPTLTFATVVNANVAPTDTVVICSAVSVNEIKSEDGFKIFPVPVENMFTVEFINPLKHDSEISIVDALGRGVAVVRMKSGSTIFNLDITHLPNGVYTVAARHNDGKLSVRKIIVMK